MPEAEVLTATLEEPEHGLPAAVLDETLEILDREQKGKKAES